MKFICENCGAKYKIPDEKIAGRTLRMKCRKCGHQLVISGKKKAQKPSAPTSQIGATFQRQTAGGFSSFPKARAQWHVSINDVPVGPITEEELSVKAKGGAIDGESLVWREGFDNWKPFRQVVELSHLWSEEALQARQAKSIPAHDPFAPVAGALPEDELNLPPQDDGPTKAVSAMDIFGGRAGHISSVPPATPQPPAHTAPETASISPAVEVAPEPIADPFAPAEPHAPSLTASISDLNLEVSSPGQAVPILAAAPDPAVVEAQMVAEVSAQRRGLPVGAWIAIAGAGFFGITLAAIVGIKMLGGENANAQVAAVTTTPAAPADSAEKPVNQELGELEFPTAADTDDEKPSRKRHGRQEDQPKHRSAPTAKEKGHGANVTDAQRRMMERMGGSGSAASINIAGRYGGSKEPQGEGLDAKQLSRVVKKNRPALQRCYERAAKGNPNIPAIRLDITIGVGMSGTVTKVRAKGEDFNGLKRCITSSVRRWSFPRSGNSTQTAFPVVFQAAS